MKIRTGFISNSSSASFICELCELQYDVEARGGVDEDEWDPPTEGLCEECFVTHFICKCHKIHKNEDGIKLDEGEAIYSGSILDICSYRVCPECLPEILTTQCREWHVKVHNPDYKLSPADKRAIENTLIEV